MYLLKLFFDIIKNFFYKKILKTINTILKTGYLLILFMLGIAICGCLTKSNTSPKQQEVKTVVIPKKETNKKKPVETKDVKQSSPSKNENIKKLHFVFFPGLGEEQNKNLIEYFKDLEKELQRKYKENGIGDVKITYIGKGCDSIQIKIRERAKYIVNNEFEDILKNKKNDEKIIIIAHSQGGITFLNCLDYLLNYKKINLDNKISHAHFVAVPFGGSINSTLLLYPIWSFMFLIGVGACFAYPFYCVAASIYSVVKNTWETNNFNPFTIMKWIYKKLINAPINSIFHTKGANDLSNFFCRSDAINTAGKTFKNIKSIIPGVNVNFIRAKTDFVVPKKESFGKKLKFPINKIVDEKKTIKNLGFWCSHMGCVMSLKTWKFITNKINRDCFSTKCAI